MVDGRFPEFVAEPYYRRQSPTAQIDCQLIDDDSPHLRLLSRNAKRIRFWLTPKIEDEKITVITGPDSNTTELRLPVTQLSKRELLDRFSQKAQPLKYDRYVEIQLN